ncbi:hypothetical protein OKA04_06985 [Luteolibacter flavescens]|uniref:Uncharacterized protein n=1 Tax=Luteolibacter flavescens TaxID=1859460 RepID=A0ABT3FNA7_9BACT|nr:hypothetical protein [Luteolibacter flavescens]MCW1884470.1 hypothetical protein [Luteolibacter flavescens]
MKQSLIPISCGTALAMMAGAAAAHWCSVRDMVTLASVLPMQSPVSDKFQAPSHSPLPDAGPSREAKEFLAQARESSGKTKPGSARTSLEKIQPIANHPSSATAGNTTDARIEKLLSLLEGTVEENQRLRESQAETNRDLMEVQFRLDMYDGEFRPLKVEEEATPWDDGSGGVLPPLE